MLTTGTIYIEVLLILKVMAPFIFINEIKPEANKVYINASSLISSIVSVFSILSCLLSSLLLFDQ